MAANQTEQTTIQPSDPNNSAAQRSHGGDPSMAAKSQSIGVSSEPTLLDSVKKKSTEQVGSSSGHKGPSVDSERNPSEHVEWVKSLLNRKMRIKVERGHYTGLFYCMDKQGNIFFKDAVLAILEEDGSYKYKPASLVVTLIPVTIQKSIHMVIEEKLPLVSQPATLTFKTPEENLQPNSLVSQPAAPAQEPLVKSSPQSPISEAAAMTFEPSAENLPPESPVIEPTATNSEPPKGNSSSKSLDSQPAATDLEPLVTSSPQSPIGEPGATASKSLVEKLSPESIVIQTTATTYEPSTGNSSPKSSVSQPAAPAPEPPVKSSPQSTISEPAATKNARRGGKIWVPVTRNSSPKSPVSQPAAPAREPLVKSSPQSPIIEPSATTFMPPAANLPPESPVIQPTATNPEPPTGNSSSKSLDSQPAVTDPEPLGEKSSPQSVISEPASTASKLLVESSPQSLVSISQPAATASVPREQNLSPKSPVIQSAATASEPLGEKSLPESLIIQPDKTASEPLENNSSQQFLVGEPASETSEPPNSGCVNNFEDCIKAGYSGHVKISFDAVPSEEDSSVGLCFIVRDDENNILASRQRLEPKYLEPGEAQAHALRDALYFALENECKDMDLEFGSPELVNKLIPVNADTVLQDIKVLRQGFMDCGWKCNFSYTDGFRDTSTYYLAKNATRVVKVSFKGYQDEYKHGFGLAVVGQNGQHILGQKARYVRYDDLKHEEAEEVEAYALLEALDFAKEKDWKNMELQLGNQELVNKVTNADSSDDGQVVKEIKEVLAAMKHSCNCKILYVSDPPNQQALLYAKFVTLLAVGKSSLDLSFLSNIRF